MTTPVATAYVLILPDTRQFTDGLRRGIDESLSGVKAKVATASKGLSDGLAKGGTDGGKALAEGVRKGTESAGHDLTGLGRVGEEAIGKLKEAAAGLVAFEGIKKLGEAFLGAGEQVEGLSGRIIAATGASGAKLEELEKTGRGLADQLPASFGDIGDAVGKLNATLGLTGKPLGDLATKFLDVAKITGTALDIPATTAALTGFGVAGKDQGKVLEQLYAASQRTGVAIGDLVSGLQAGGPTFRQFGLSAAQSGNLLAGLQRNGVESSKVTTGLRVAFSNFSKAGLPAQAALVTTVAKMKEFIDAGNTPKAASIAAKVFGTRGASAFTAAVKSGALSVDSLTRSAGAASKPIEDTEARTRTLGDDLKILGNNINNALGDKAVKTLQFLATQVGKLTKEFHSPETKRFVAEVKADLVPALKAVGNFLTTLVIPGVTAVVDAFRKNATPIVREFAKVLRNDIGPAFEALGKRIEAARPSLAKIGNLFLDIQHAIATVAPYIEAIYAKYFALLIREAGFVIEKLIQVAGFIAGLADAAVGLLSKAGPPIKAFGDVFLSILGGLLEGIQKFLDFASNIPGVGGKFRDAANAIGDARQQVADLKANIDSLSDKTVTITIRTVTVEQKFVQSVNPGASISTGSGGAVGPILQPGQQAQIDAQNRANRQRAADAAAAARASARVNLNPVLDPGAAKSAAKANAQAAKDAAKAQAQATADAARTAGQSIADAARATARNATALGKAAAKAAADAAKAATAAAATGFAGLGAAAAKAAREATADAAKAAADVVAATAKTRKAISDATRARTAGAVTAAQAEAKAAADAGKAAAKATAAAVAAAAKAQHDLAVALVGKQITARKFVESITGGADAINAQFDKLIASVKGAGGTAKLLAFVEAQRKALLAKSAQQGTFTASLGGVSFTLDTARTHLADLQKTAADYRDTVHSAIVDTGNLANANSINFVGIRNTLRHALDQAKAFAAAIATLTKAGLNTTGLQQLIAAGPEQGLAAARALLSGGKAGIAAVNALQGQLDAAGTKLGKATADTFYAQGIRAAQGLVDGLASQEAALEAQMVKLANAMVATLKKGLGIHSPSIVFEGLGHNVGLGLARGIDTAAPAVSAAASRSLTQINLGGVSVHGVADAAAARTAGAVLGAGVADALARNRLVAALGAGAVA